MKFKYMKPNHLVGNIVTWKDEVYDSFSENDKVEIKRVGIILSHYRSWFRNMCLIQDMEIDGVFYNININNLEAV